ncbi:hypothetical protein CS545_04155 [Porphyromonas gingivalis]|nr:hypothetical protein CS545_04155 [Porphyromonas gingivalis]
MTDMDRILWSHMRGYYGLIKVRNEEEKMPDPYPATNIRSIRYDNHASEMNPIAFFKQKADMLCV